jgi:acetylornithine deacetylase/succinyl-diaminopimelate desuccinylase-like protein
MNDLQDSENPVQIDSEMLSSSTSAIEAKFHVRMADLGQLARVPGIAWPSFDPAELEKSAALVAAKFESLEFFDTVKIERVRYQDNVGAPAILARRAAKPGYPHVLLYAHHDVQPPGDDGAWESQPFIPELRGDRLYGRGVADDKAGIVTHLAALETLKTLESDSNLGVTLFIEGEEEAGSPSFDNFLTQFADELRADVIVVADSGNWDTETPALTTSLRGLVSQVIELKTLDHAVHSGMFGGPVLDAMTAMIRLLATLHDELGDVAIAGLKRSPVKALDYPESRLRDESGLLEGVAVIGKDAILQSNWGNPAVTVIGLDYPSVAMSSNTLHPVVRAKISLRLAPDEVPEEALMALRSHLDTNLPFGSQLEYQEVELGPGFYAKESPASRLAKAAFEAAWQTAAVEIGVGGSIPFISKFQQKFVDAQILVTGVEDPDSRAHSPNESLHIPTLKKAMVAESLLLRTLNSSKWF